MYTGRFYEGRGEALQHTQEGGSMRRGGHRNIHRRGVL